MSCMTNGVQGVPCFIDGIIVIGAMERERLRNQLFERLFDYGFTAEMEK